MNPYREPGVPINPDRRARLEAEYADLASRLMYRGGGEAEILRAAEIIRTLKSLPVEPFYPEPVPGPKQKTSWLSGFLTPLRRRTR